MKHATLVLAALALLVGGVEQAKADFLFFGTAEVQGDITDAPSGFSAGPVSGFPTLSNPISATAQGAFEGSTGAGQAYVRFVTPAGFSQGFTWELQSAVQAFYPGYPFSPVSVSSGATWQDVLYLSNTDPLLVGRTLRLNFMATGYYSYSGYEQVFSGLGVEGENLSPSTINGGFDNGASATAVGSGTYGPPPYGGIQNSGPWDSFQSNSAGQFAGTFHLDIPIVPGQGNGFLYSVLDNIGNGGPSGFGADPAGFLSITLPDVGNVTPESLGVSVSFASGIVSPNLQPTAAPEPASLTLLGIGCVSLLGYAGLRRKRAGKVAPVA